MGDVEAEISYDCDRFDADALGTEGHLTSIRAGLAVRQWLENENLDAFSMNFLAIDKASGLGAVPFLEASKGMAQGIGYAGEGDVMTAAYVASLMSVFPETTFTEIFCPDWKNDTLFLSHMGEINVNCIEGRPKLILKPFPYTDADEPVAAVGRLMPGRGMFTDLAPGPGGTYTLIAVPGEMEKVKGEDRMENMVHGWFKPDCGIETCLAEYSRAGGTHHSAFTYSDCKCELQGLSEIMGWKYVVID
jgi:L-arabinose isomerase